MTDSGFHKPVLIHEVLAFLSLKKGQRVLDATLGGGGHASLIQKMIGPEGLLIGIDRDSDSLAFAERRLKAAGKNYKLAHANFSEMDRVLNGFGIDKVDAALFDLGISSFQLESANRGFSFEKDAPLDMRMDTSGGMLAHDIVNRVKENELKEIIKKYGEERYAGRIASFIAAARKKKPIESARELAAIIKRAVGGRYRFQKINPATRTFQALRITVNRELESLEEALSKITSYLNPKSRLAVISFHSLEDRIVKYKFRDFEKSGSGSIITKKPITADESEIRRNPRSRSAKLRVFEKR